MGKLLIAWGEWIFGLNSFGWRFARALFGSLAILLMCRIARRLTRSTLLGCIAGLLLALDGLEFVLSPDRDPGHLPDVLRAGRVRLRAGRPRRLPGSRLAERVARREGGGSGPQLGIRRWRVAAGIFLGLAWRPSGTPPGTSSGSAALVIAWDIGARRTAGLKSFVRGGLREARGCR